MLKKPQNVYMPIDRLQAKVLKRKDPVKKAEWVDNFVLALSEEAEDPFAKELLEKAQFDYYKDTLRTWRLKAKKSLSFNGNEPSDKQIHEWCCEEYGDEYIEALHLLSKNSKRFSKKIQNLLSKNPQDAPNGNAGVDSKSATSCDQFTADGDTREGSLDEKSVTSADNCGPRQAKNGDASHREAEDESATVSNPFALDMPGPDKGEQSAKTRDSHGSGRYQPPSLGPADGNHYDQATASGNYQVPDKVSTKPAGGHLKRSSSRSPVGDVLSLAYSGEFGNVRLTQEQYAELGIRFGNQQKLNRAIDSLSCLIENGEKNPQNHYAELVKWANYRDDMDERKEEEASKPKMTEMEKSWIAAMKRVEAM